ncbi:MAG: hypothetical protein M3083_04165 [Actinomycetota bacterium]|nr:hypothetical protein [Actinomycetota bacterium]
MGKRVVEEMVRINRLGPKRRMRIDLHGVSTFGPGRHHTLIRWEWISEIAPSHHGVVIDSGKVQIIFPSGVFGLDPHDLADRLEEARSIFKRGEIIEQLSRTPN